MNGVLRRLRTGLARNRSLLVMYLVSGAVGVPLWLTGVTVAISAGDYRTDGGLVRTGTARVEQCERDGPVSLDGFGYRWRCDAVVRWDDGHTGRVTVRHGQLSPADTGRQVSLGERRSRGRGYITEEVVPPYVTDTGRATTGHILSVTGIVVGLPFLAMTGALALFLAVVAGLMALFTVVWLGQLVTSPRSAMASARRFFRRPPPNDAP